MEQTNKYFAFISYNSNDLKWGKKLQAKLESFRLPANMRTGEKGLTRKPMNPIFFAPTDIQPGPLTEEIKRRLEASKNLVVICSPNSAKSVWVGQEIEYFYKDLGRKDNVHFFIVDGIPHCADKNKDCFNPVINKLGMPETLGANIHEEIYRWSYLNKERAYIQLVSKMLGVEFDSLWKRQQRRLKNRIMCMLCTLLLSLSFIYIFAIPFRLSINIKDAQHNLPVPDDAVLVINDSHYPLKNLETDIVEYFPGIWKFRSIDVKLNATYYDSVKCCVSPHGFWEESKTISLQRDNTFAIYAGQVIYGEWLPLENVKVNVGGKSAYTAHDGKFKISFPTSEQSVSKKVVVEKDGYATIVRQNEVPGVNIGYIMFKK